MCGKSCELWNSISPYLAAYYPVIIGIVVFLILCSPRLTLKIAAWVTRLVMFRLRVIGKENMPIPVRSFWYRIMFHWSIC